MIFETKELLHIQDLTFNAFISNKLLECKDLSKIEIIFDNNNRFLLIYF